MFWNRTTQTPAQSGEQIRNRLDSVEIPDAAMFEASALNILSQSLGFRRSLETSVCMLGDERVIPMMSYGLIEYLMGLDLSAFELLELGGGHSTEFWDQRTKSVTTLETDPEWVRILGSNTYSNTKICSTTADTIGDDMMMLKRNFDAIIIDANASRYRCAKAGLRMLNAGGFILLDNSDWYPNTTAMLRGADLLQVDFHDFRPLRWYRCATSLFLHKDFRARPRYGKLPQPLIGGKDISASNDWDRVE